MKSMYSLFKHWGPWAWLLTIFIFLIAGCGEPTGSPPLFISGNVSGQALDENPGYPIMAVVIRASDIAGLRELSLSSIAAYVGVDPTTRSFRIDLTQSGLAPGEKLFVAAFIDRSPPEQPPYPNVGDIIGFYLNRQTFSTDYVLKPGENAGVQIQISRVVYDYSAVITGNVVSPAAGDLILLAYAGDFPYTITQLNPNAIIGYHQLSIENQAAYQLPVLPYGYDVPIEGVYIIAFLDVDRNGQMGPGDKIGYFTMDPRLLPTPIRVDAGETPNIDIRLFMDLSPPNTANELISDSLNFTP